MTGRITSEPPARNEHGVPYYQILQRERAANARHVARLREAIEEWLAAAAEGPNSRSRRTRMARARILSQLALS